MTKELPDSRTCRILEQDVFVIVYCVAEHYPNIFKTKLEESMKLNVNGTRHLAK